MYSMGGLAILGVSCVHYARKASGVSVHSHKITKDNQANLVSLSSSVKAGTDAAARLTQATDRVADTITQLSNSVAQVVQEQKHSNTTLDKMDTKIEHIHKLTHTQTEFSKNNITTLKGIENRANETLSEMKVLAAKYRG